MNTKSFKSLHELLQRCVFNLKTKQTALSKFHRIIPKGTLSKNIFTFGLRFRFSWQKLYTGLISQCLLRTQ